LGRTPPAAMVTCFKSWKIEGWKIVKLDKVLKKIHINTRELEICLSTSLTLVVAVVVVVVRLENILFWCKCFNCSTQRYSSWNQF
jgi:hypothetical protein